MAHLARGTASTAASPLLDLWITENGVIADPDAGSLTFTIVDISTDANEMSPVTVVAPVTVDLDADRIADQTGHFAAVGSPLLPADETTGAHEVRWSWTIDGKSFSYAQRFDVLEGLPRGIGQGYALVSDFRGEDFCEDAASTLRLLKLIDSESRRVETFTRRFFEPRYLKLRVDGTGDNTLLLGHPIIALSSVSIVEQPIAIDFDSDELRIYNRHLLGLLDPDDRKSPQISIPNIRWPYELGGTWSGIFSSSPSIRRNFPDYEQNVHVEGLFGYTDPDGTHLGRTPTDIRDVVMLMVQRKLPKLTDTDALFDLQEGHRVTSLKTRDQSIDYGPKRVAGAIPFTGDPEIDRLLSAYTRSLRVGST